MIGSWLLLRFVFPAPFSSSPTYLKEKPLISFERIVLQTATYFDETVEASLPLLWMSWLWILEIYNKHTAYGCG
jgi:hypothetical protein